VWDSVTFAGSLRVVLARCFPLIDDLASSKCRAAFLCCSAFLCHGVVLLTWWWRNPTAAPILSFTRTEKVGRLVEDIRSFLLCSTRLPKHKAVSEKDVSSSQHKAVSHSFRLSRFVGLLE